MLTTRPTSQLDPVDQALPLTVSSKSSSWANKAQHYPIFSPTWLRYRLLGFIVPMILLAVFLAITSIVLVEQEGWKGGARELFVVWLGVLILLSLGRYLAMLIYTKAWSERRQMLALISAIILGIAVSYLFFKYTDGFEDLRKARIAKKQLEKNTVTTDFQAGLKLGMDSANKQLGTSIQIEPGSKATESLSEGTLSKVLNGFFLIWLGGAFDFIAYLRQTRAIKEAQLREKLDRYQKQRNEAEMRLSVLASQVEPHFLFNTLTGVRAAMLSDPARGVVIIDHLVDYLRSTIPQMRSDGTCVQTQLQQQLDSVRAYLGVICTRIPRLVVQIECANELLGCSVPPLMLISLVENAVKHGIELKKGNVEIRVIAEKIDDKEEEKLRISVIDNGLGFGQTSSGSGIGLTNIRERLKQLYGEQAALSLHAREEGGVRASITLPLSFSVN
ncbi:MAG: histidine kinase [Undibacterium sp.]|nr:histidine kinase [Undibacterium sp.]